MYNTEISWTLWVNLNVSTLEKVLTYMNDMSKSLTYSRRISCCTLGNLEYKSYLNIINVTKLCSRGCSKKSNPNYFLNYNARFYLFWISSFSLCGSSLPLFNIYSVFFWPDWKAQISTCNMQLLNLMTFSKIELDCWKI